MDTHTAMRYRDAIIILMRLSALQEVVVTIACDLMKHLGTNVLPMSILTAKGFLLTRWSRLNMNPALKS